MVSVWFTHCKKIVKVIRNFSASPLKDYDEKINEVMEELHNAVYIEGDSGSSTDQEDAMAAVTCDKETNTVSMYSDRPTIKRRPQEGPRSSTIRRSQTFSPACRPGSQYVCRVSVKLCILFCSSAKFIVIVYV